MIEKNNSGREIKLTKKKLNGWKLNTVIPPSIKGKKNIIKILLLKKFNINYLQFSLELIFLFYSFCNNLCLYDAYNLVNEQSHVPIIY